MPTVSENEWEDDEYLVDQEEATDWAVCRECGKAMYADAELCPSCGHFVTDEAEAILSPRRWVRWTAVLLLLAILLPVLVQIFRKG